jgi:hypothetical protein
MGDGDRETDPGAPRDSVYIVMRTLHACADSPCPKIQALEAALGDRPSAEEVAAIRALRDSETRRLQGVGAAPVRSPSPQRIPSPRKLPSEDFAELTRLREVGSLASLHLGHYVWTTHRPHRPNTGTALLTQPATSLMHARVPVLSLAGLIVFPPLSPCSW